MKATWKERARYAFDKFMSRGTAALVAALFVASILLVVGATVFVWLAGALAGWKGTSDTTFIGGLWSALLHTLDSSYIESDIGEPLPLILAMLVLTFGGIFVVALLIGIVSNGIQTRLMQLRKGTSRVIERDHVVILGWSQQIFTILAELVEANVDRRRSCIVVLADMDKVEMEDAIHARIRHTKGTRVVCRTGDPIDLAELVIANVQSARSILVLAPQTDDPDIDVIKIILAIINDPARRAAPYHVVAEIHEPGNLDVARSAGGDEVQLVLSGDLIARITAQTCRQPGLSVVYTELLDFVSDEMYVQRLPEVAGVTFGDALLRFEDSALVGLLGSDGTPKLNPPMETVIRPDDMVVVIAEDDDTVRVSGSGAPTIDLDAIVSAPVRTAHPERTLVLGWNWRAPRILAELDHYVAPGSEVMVVADQPDAEAAAQALAEAAVNQRVTVRQGSTTDRSVLDTLAVETFDHVVILSYSDVLERQRADARTLVTLLHLREIGAAAGRNFSMVSEMLDLRNRAVAEVTRADDFIVSDRLTSLYLSQISETRELGAVFDDLFGAAGSEIFLRPASDYVVTGRPVTFYTVVESARRQGQVAIGYRRHALFGDATQSYGVLVNPDKSVPMTFEPRDKVIVLAEN